MQTYTNPIASDGDFADPFVLRFNGRYYLYCTNADLRCWSSTDLLHWTLEGPSIAPGTFGDLVPFAPEVTYDNGAFHLYTSPSGTGHRILRADRPTGPFVPVTGNIGHSIDGHVFVDDDGRRYFYWAGDEGIWGCEMASPTELGEPVLTGASMHGWTEGPFVIKRDGRYHMTLTGNHYLSPGYRINAAVSDHPLHGYHDSPLNPVLLSTVPGQLGLGHSSSVLGPDLVSTYLVYHNLNPDRSRDLNIDRQAWTGDLLQILGPSQQAPAPEPPDHFTSWGANESACWEVLTGSLVEHSGMASLRGPGQLRWRNVRLSEYFTSEHTLSSTAGQYGILAMDAAEEGWRFEIEARTNQVRVLAAGPHGMSVLTAAELPAGYRHDVLHCLRLVVSDGRVEVFVDGQRQLEFRPERISGLTLGYHCADGSLTIGHTAATHTVESRASAVAPRPVPGRFLADPPVLSGGTSSQRILVPAPGRYDLCLAGEFPAGSVLTVVVDGQLTEHEIPWATTAISTPLRLDQGAHTLAVESGAATLRTIDIQPAPAGPARGCDRWESSGTGKLLLPRPTIGDWDLTATVRLGFETPDAHADLLLCARELAEGGEGDDTALGIDFLLGYSVQLHRRQVVLARHAYDERPVAQRDAIIDPERPHAIVVSRRGGEVVARIDDLEPLILSDPWPHAGGQLGLRTRGARITVEQLELAPVGGTAGS